MKSVVITGADGFIGSHLVRRFAERGYEVFALTIPNSPVISRIKGIANVRVFEEELQEWARYADEMPQKPAALIHLAWAGVTPESRTDTELQMSNIRLCMDAAKMAAGLQAERFILPGSTMEYAYSGGLINKESCPSPQNAYGAAKIAARYLCGALCEELELPFIYAVISGIYSAQRQDNNVIFYTLKTLLKGECPALTRLEQLWDYVHIDDVTRAFCLIAEKGKGGAFYAIGHGDNWPLSNYIYMIRDAIDPRLPLGVGEIPYKDERLPSSCVDLRSLREDTGFVPEISFEEGIRGVIATVKKSN